MYMKPLYFLSITRYCITNYLKNGSSETREVALVCFGQHYKTIPIMFMVKGTMALISVFFILLTLYVYWIIQDLRETQVNLFDIFDTYSSRY